MQRVTINKENNKVILNFNSYFYNEKHIEQAIKDFNEICDFKKEDNNLVLTPKKSIRLDKLGYEFYNYVLNLMKNM